jgi:two-component sensor histidine kinase
MSFNNYAQTSEFEFDSLPFYSKKLDYKGAINYLEREKQRIPIENDSALADWRIVHAKFLIYRGKFDKGIENLKQVEENCLNNGFNVLIQKAKIQIADCYRTIRMVEQAMQEIKKVDEKIIGKDTFLLVKYLHRKAAIFSQHNFISKEDKDLDTSHYFSKKALTLAKKNNYLDAQATCYNELASNKIVPRKLANDYYDSAITIWGKIDLANYVHALNNKANHYLQQEKYDSASIYLSLSDTSIRNKEFPFLKVETYRLLSKLNYGLGDSIVGNKFRLLEETARADYWEELAESRLHELTVEYESKEKDEIISERNQSILEEENRTRLSIIFSIVLLIILIVIGFFYYLSQKKNKRLNELLQENEFLIGESNHRIKNNLQLIVSLIERELFKEGIENNKLHEISEKIKSIAILHQQLYLKNSKEEVSVKNYLEEIKENFHSSFADNDIEISLLVEDFAMKIDKSVFLGLLITELVTNSLKHAFKNLDSKIIDIKIVNNSGVIHFLYADNGVGIKENKKPSLVLILIKQLKGDFNIDNENGFSLNLKFKP